MKRFVPRWQRTAACLLLALVYLAGILRWILPTPIDEYAYAYYVQRNAPYWLDLSVSSGRPPEQSMEMLRSFPTEDIALIVKVYRCMEADTVAVADVEFAKLLRNFYEGFFGEGAAYEPFQRVRHETMLTGRLDNVSILHYYFYDKDDNLMCIIANGWFDGWLYSMPAQNTQTFKDAERILFEQYGVSGHVYYFPFWGDGPDALFFVLCGAALLGAAWWVRHGRGRDLLPFLSTHERLPRRVRLMCFAHLYGQPYAGRS